MSTILEEPPLRATNNQSRKPLGRGLSALLGDDSPAPYRRLAEDDKAKNDVLALPVDQLAGGQFQPRENFDDDSLQELADSIKQQGILQPILVRKRGHLKPGQPAYEIVAGERRWRAAKLAGLAEVSVIIKSLSDAEALEIGIVENIQRKDLSPIEEAQGYNRLIREFGYDKERLSNMLSRSSSHVVNMLRLLKLAPSVQESVANGVLSMGHARALINAPEQEELAAKIIAGRLSVREVEQLVQQYRDQYKPARSRSAPSPKGNVHAKAELLGLARKIQSVLRLKKPVQVQAAARGESGKLILAYKDKAELGRILESLGAE